MITKIISGGQTGVDMAALDFAIEKKIKTGGYCPRGRKNENGIIPERYMLTENSSSHNLDRTKKNIEISDATLIITSDEECQGTKDTIKYAKMQFKPFIIFNDHDFFMHPRDSAYYFRLWLKKGNIKTLNIGGNRESHSPGIYKKAKEILNILYEEMQT